MAGTESQAHFVGRQRELRTLHEQAQASAEGRGGCVLIGGPPGIGKSRLVERCIESLGSLPAGAVVLRGHCYEGDATPAYWPWIEVLRGALQLPVAGDLLRAPGASPEQLAALLPELDLTAREPAAQRDDDARAGRFPLFNAVTSVLKQVAAGGAAPAVVLLEDAHWADADSLLLLEFAVQALSESPLLVLATYRDTEIDGTPFADALRRLSGLPRCVRLPLAGLSNDEVARFIAAVSGAALPDELAASIGADTEGNPLFVAELVRSVLERHGGRWPREGLRGLLQVPPSVSQVILRRLDRVSDPCRQLLISAAVMGSEFKLALLDRIFEGGGDSLLQALEEAELARLVEPVPGAAGSYRFSHALIRAAVYESLPGSRRLRLHHRIGELLEQLWGGDPEHLTELTQHFLQAAPAGGAVKAVEYARRTAERSVRMLAYEDGVRYYQLALAALEQGAAEDRAQRCTLLLALAETQSRAGDRRGAVATIQRASDVARSLSSPAATPAPEPAEQPGAQLLARAALALGRIADTVGQLHTLLVPLLEEALGLLGAGDTAERATCLSRLAQELLFTNRSDEALALSLESVAVARRTGDRRCLFWCLYRRFYACSDPARIDEGAALVDDLEQIAERLSDPELTLRALRWRIRIELERGQIAAMDATIERYARVAGTLRQPFFLWQVGALRAMRALLGGRVAEAERLALEAYRMRRALGDQDAAITLSIQANQLFIIRREQGRGEDLEAGLQQAVDRTPAMPAYRAALALLYCELRHEQAAAELARLAAHEFADLPRDGLFLSTAAHLAEVCSYLGDAGRAATLYGLLAPFADRVGVVGDSAACVGSIQRYLALLAATRARAGAGLDAWQRAFSHFEAAIAANERMGAQGFAAHSRFDYAGALLDQHRVTCGATGTRGCYHAAHAADLLDGVPALARSLGMERLAALAEVRLAEIALAAGPPGGTALPDGLTAREAEVLQRVAAGMSNREIAGNLVLTVVTVQNHLANIYRKIDAHSRSEAAAYAFRNQLAQPLPAERPPRT